MDTNIHNEVTQRTAENDAIAKKIAVLREELAKTAFVLPMRRENFGTIMSYAIEFTPACIASIREILKNDILEQIAVKESELQSKTADLAKFMKTNRYGI